MFRAMFILSAIVILFSACNTSSVQVRYEQLWIAIENRDIDAIRDVADGILDSQLSGPNAEEYLRLQVFALTSLGAYADAMDSIREWKPESLDELSFDIAEGWLLIRLGRIEEANEVLRNAIDSRDDKPVGSMTENELSLYCYANYMLSYSGGDEKTDLCIREAPEELVPLFTFWREADHEELLSSAPFGYVMAPVVTPEESIMTNERWWETED